MTFHKCSTDTATTLIIHSAGVRPSKKKTTILLEAQTMANMGKTTTFHFNNFEGLTAEKNGPLPDVTMHPLTKEAAKAMSKEIKKCQKNGCDVLCVTKSTELTLTQALDLAKQKGKPPYDEVFFKFDLPPKLHSGLHVPDAGKKKKVAVVKTPAAAALIPLKTRMSARAIELYQFGKKANKKLVIYAEGKVPNVPPGKSSAKIEISEKMMAKREIFFKGTPAGFNAKSKLTNFTLLPATKPKKGKSIRDRAAAAHPDCDVIVVCDHVDECSLMYVIKGAESQRKKVPYTEVHCEFAFPRGQVNMVVNQLVAKQGKKPTKGDKEKTIVKVITKTISINGDKKKKVILHTTKRKTPSKRIVISSHGTSLDEELPKVPCKVNFKVYENFSTKGSVGEMGAYSTEDWTVIVPKFTGGTKDHGLTHFKPDTKDQILKAVTSGYDVITIKGKCKVRFGEILEHIFGTVEGKKPKDYKVTKGETSKDFPYGGDAAVYCLFCRS
mmetsp:Transcript_13838/g.22924  ORF Transcript_13838/g.22924 Transcript_13838/m.22924 type:complete len:496 (-) Transcript_13838:90-1577(-)